jgi:two-component system phosphate regulon sensor histidine kinase PhoR
MEDKAIRKSTLNVPKRVERLIYRRRFRYDTKLESGDLNFKYTDFDIVELIQNVFDIRDESG